MKEPKAFKEYFCRADLWIGALGHIDKSAFRRVVFRAWSAGRRYQAKKTKPSPDWFLMYRGHSVDGRGPCKFAARTQDREIAAAFFRSECLNPYSTGKVLIVSDESERLMTEKDTEK